MENPRSERKLVAEKFLKQLEDQSYVFELIEDRLDQEIISVMSTYASKLARVKTDYPKEELYTGFMIIGYLMKSYMDRIELTKSLKQDY